jgi:hypothetical protein
VRKYKVKPHKIAIIKKPRWPTPARLYFTRYYASLGVTYVAYIIVAVDGYVMIHRFFPVQHGDAHCE